MSASLRVLCGGLALFLAACSSFETDWSQSRVHRQSDPFAGRWEGRWTSAKHANAGGRLRCVLQPIDAAHYRAAFKANWLAFSSSYVMTLEAQRRGQELHIQGTHRLPAIFGGVYRYRGRATQSQLRAQYHSSYDNGIFEMSKVAAEARRSRN